MLWVQGAMTAVDAALSLPAGQGCAGVISVSGAPIVVEEWAKKAKAHAGLRALVTHGMADQVIHQLQWPALSLVKKRKAPRGDRPTCRMNHHVDCMTKVMWPYFLLYDL